MKPPPHPDLISIAVFCARYGVGRTTAYKLIRKRDIVAVKIGRLTRIRVDSAEKWMQALPTA